MAVNSSALQAVEWWNPSTSCYGFCCSIAIIASGDGRPMVQWCVCVCVQGGRQLPRSCAAEGPSLRAVWGSPPESFSNLDGKSCTLGDSMYKIIHRNFFSTVFDVPRGPTFWEVGTAMAVPAVPVAPALLCVCVCVCICMCVCMCV